MNRFVPVPVFIAGIHVQGIKYVQHGRALHARAPAFRGGTPVLRARAWARALHALARAFDALLLPLEARASFIGYDNNRVLCTIPGTWYRDTC